MSNVPPCPLCGSDTKRRESSRGPFWGCTRYPQCKGSMDYFDYTSGMDVTQTAAWQRASRAYIFQKQQEVQRQLAASQQATDRAVAEVLAAKEVEKVDEPKPKKAKKDMSALLEKAAKAGAVVIKKIDFKPSQYQQAIFDWIEKTNDRSGKDVDALVVEALAGSGKTTTAVELMKLIPTSQKVAFVAFNVHIKDALAAKTKAMGITNAKVTTYHGLGLIGCYRAFSDGLIIDDEGKKLQALLENTLDKQTHRHIYPVIRQIVTLVKATLVGTDDASLDELESRYGIEMNGDKEIIHEAVRIIIQRSAENTKIVDFDDMVWLPVWHNISMPKYDVIIIDEAQDTNKAQVALALMSVKANGRIIAVGDRNQSVYGFRGADVDSIPTIIDTLHADVLPLSITYRNPKSVVNMVNGRFPQIPLQAAEWAKDGQIQNISSNAASGMWIEGDMILCRTNAPLVSYAFELIRRNVKAVIRGRDIGQGLMALVRKMECQEVTDLLAKLNEYRSKEVAKLMESDKTMQAQSLGDKVDTIIALCDGIDDTLSLEGKIDSIFSDDKEGVVFSSIHRAKGLEAERVFILHPELMPHPMAKQPWERGQEDNIEYVALTRTMDQLYFVME